MSLNQKKKIIAPSILSADFTRLAEEITDVDKAGSDWLHVDVMDGHFVPNLTIGPPVIGWIRKITKLPLDVHLMIEEPAKSVEQYRKAGADYITVHFEACSDIQKTLKQIRLSGARAGISLKPKTDIKRLEPYLGLVDLVLIMTVDPGFGGQEFMPEMLKKVEFLRPRFAGLISVDGGINLKTGTLASKSGADVFVAGSAIFKQANRKEFISQLRQSVA